MDWKDTDRRAFLNALDDSDTVTPSDWECDFLSSTMDQQTFSLKQRAVIDKMIDRYGDSLHF